MKTIQIKLTKKTDHSHKIFIGHGVSDTIPAHLKKMELGEKYLIITDSKVKKLYGDAFVRYLKKHDIKADILDFPFGEKQKNIRTVENLAEKALEKHLNRKDAIIALGGGVVGDMAGFLASIYMRGIPYIQIPTTLLAMVDSSVGGKTGVDLSNGKNLLGTFTQPKAVFIDPAYLKSLSPKQIKNGLAEIIKYGVIKDKDLFIFIERNVEKILKLDHACILKIILDSIKIKAEIVEKDEKEADLRMILNYGHTYGHALEKLSGYNLLHGYAISIGMVLINKMAVEKKILNKKDAERIKNLIRKAGLPIAALKKPTLKDIQNDKKNTGNFINLVMPKKIGEVIIYKGKCR